MVPEQPRRHEAAADPFRDRYFRKRGSSTRSSRASQPTAPLRLAPSSSPRPAGAIRNQRRHHRLAGGPGQVDVRDLLPEDRDRAIEGKDEGDPAATSFRPLGAAWAASRVRRPGWLAQRTAAYSRSFSPAAGRRRAARRGEATSAVNTGVEVKTRRRRKRARRRPREEG